MLSCLRDDAYKRTLAANQKDYPMWHQRVSTLSLSEWSFTICLMPYNRKYNVLSVSLNKTFPTFVCCLFLLNQIKAEISPVLSVLQDVATHLLNSAQKLEGTVNVHSDRVSVSVQKADPNINELKITATPDHPDGAGGAFLLPNDMKSTGNNSIDMQVCFLY